jgi:ketosteroid isomerase-like protein
MAYTNPIADEMAIRDLSARYIDAVNRSHGEDWQATWSENASWFLMGQEITGRDNILEFWLNTMGLFNFVVMALNSQTMVIDGDRATGRCYVTEYLSMKGADPASVQGVYDDIYIRENGEWRIASRSYHMLYQGPTDLSGEYQPYPG